MMGLFLSGESKDAIEAGVLFLRIVSPMYFMIRGEADDRRHYPGSWGYEIFCDRYGAGSDLKDLYGRNF